MCECKTKILEKSKYSKYSNTKQTQKIYNYNYIKKIQTYHRTKKKDVVCFFVVALAQHGQCSSDRCAQRRGTLSCNDNVLFNTTRVFQFEVDGKRTTRRRAATPTRSKSYSHVTLNFGPLVFLCLFIAYFFCFFCFFCLFFLSFYSF